MSDGEWVLVELDGKVSKRHGLPPKIPVPAAKFESLASTGLHAPDVRQWIQAFSAQAPDFSRDQPELAARFSAFVAKGPHWEKILKGGSDAEATLKALKLVCRLDPEDHPARYNLGLLLASLGQHQEAAAALAAVESTFADDAEYWVAVGNLRQSLLQQEPAIEAFVKALELKSDCRDAMEGLTRLGVLTRLYEDPKDAASLTYVRSDSIVTYLETVWDAAPRDGAYFLEQVAYHQAEQRFDAVIAAADRGLRVASESEREPLSRARVAALRTLRRPEALSEARALCEAMPDSAGARLELSFALAEAGDVEGAEREGAEALRLDPGDQAVLVARLWPSDQGDIQAIHDGLPSLRAHAEAHSEAAGAWRSLARATLRTGAVEPALEFYARAAALAPSDDDLRSEYWGELIKLARTQEVLDDAARISDMNARHWTLRWNEAEAFAASGKSNEARTAFFAIAHDERLLADVRRRARRAFERLQQGGAG